jgi:hypothetical protein
MRSSRTLSCVAALAIAALTAGCNKKAPDTPNYKGAIDAWYQAHPVCLWQNEKQLPVQSAPDDAKTEGYDALVDQGLLTRTTSEKKIIIVSKRENNYDLSAQGHSAWTADPSQPGYGNFCFGHRSVSSIDSSTPASGQPGAKTTVDYHYTISDAPAWAKAAETQTAFPQLRAALAGPQAGTATLVDTQQGWQVDSVSPPLNSSNNSSTNSSNPADAHIAH